MSKKKSCLGVMLRTHERGKTLRIVLRELFRYQADLGLDVKVHVLADRLSFSAQEALDEFAGRFYGVKYLEWPILSAENGELFREAKRFQLRELERCRPDWVLLQDDDRWFEPLGIDKELPAALANEDIDLWYAQSWFVWDRSNQFNANRHHHSPVLFRWEPGLEFPLDRDIQAPLPIHDEAIVQGRASTLGTPLLDYGTFSAAERLRVYNAFLAAGKADAYVQSIQEPPRLVSIDEALKRPWKDLWLTDQTPSASQSPAL